MQFCDNVVILRENVIVLCQLYSGKKEHLNPIIHNIHK